MKLSMLRAIYIALSLFLVAASPQDASAAGNNYSDIWWNPAESGWGLAIADHETQLFAVWYTYNADGSPTWFVIPGGTLSADKRTFTGDIYRTTGPPYSNPFFIPSVVTATKVGTMSLDFAPSGVAAGSALFKYALDGVTGSKVIQRQPFGNAPASWGEDLTDIWWNSSESGWGLTLAQHGNNVFGVWYTYDSNGQPLFVTFPGVTFTASNKFTATAYTTTGPWFGAAVFDPSMVVATPGGSFSFNFDPVPTAISALKVAPRWHGAWNGTFRNSTQIRAFSPQPFGLLTAPTGSCSGNYVGTLTNNFPSSIGSGCGYSARYDFSGTIRIDGVDWIRTGSQQAAIKLSPGGFVCGYDGSFAHGVYQPYDLDRAPLLQLSRTNTNLMVGHGRDQDAADDFVIDFQVNGGTVTNGTFSLDHYDTRYYYVRPWKITGTFSCIPPH